MEFEDDECEECSALQEKIDELIGEIEELKSEISDLGYQIRDLEDEVQMYEERAYESENELEDWQSESFHESILSDEDKAYLIMKYR